MDTIYAGCHHCGHIEPRPDHALECWDPCENCRDIDVQDYSSYEIAAEAIDQTDAQRASEFRPTTSD